MQGVTASWELSMSFSSIMRETIHLTHGSLFTGIGGFDAGAHMQGITNVWACEVDKYCQKLLKNEPYQHVYDDIRTLHNPPRVDIISAGFPCQDLSQAGKMAGINGERTGLWREAIRVVRCVRPRYALFENSTMLLQLGFEQLLYELSEAGYSAEWQCIQNADFGFPHRRERCYIIAYAHSERQQAILRNNGSIKSIFKPRPSKEHDAYTSAKRIYEIPDLDDIQPNDGIPNFTNAIKALGNAVNPYVASYLFNCIKSHHNENH